MSHRRLIRPSLAEINDKMPKGPKRKPAPPEMTNAEAFYYVKQMNGRTPVVVMLNGDEQIEGVIEWYDKSCIKLNRAEGPDLMIMKHAIRYIHKVMEDKSEMKLELSETDAAD